MRPASRSRSSTRTGSRPRRPGPSARSAIRGATVFDGYEANPEANAAAFVDGWFRTGDQGIARRGRLPVPARPPEGADQSWRREGRPGRGRGGAARDPGRRTSRGLRDAGSAAGRGGGCGRGRGRGSPPERARPPGPRRRAARRLQGPARDPDRARRSRRVRPARSSGSGWPSASAWATRTGRARYGPAAEPRLEPAAIGRATSSDRVRELEAALVAHLGARSSASMPVGVTDDFFELGGDSMLAAMIVTAHRGSAGSPGPAARHLPLGADDRAIRTKASTPAHGKRRLRRCCRSSPKARARRSSSSTSTTGSSSLASLRRIPRPGPAALRAARRSASTAANYRHRSMALLRRLPRTESERSSPSGPYYLGGYCSGGRVAIEMARRLERRRRAGRAARTGRPAGRSTARSLCLDYIRRARLHRRQRTVLAQARRLRSAGSGTRMRRPSGGSHSSDDPYGRSPCTDPRGHSRPSRTAGTSIDLQFARLRRPSRPSGTESPDT